MSNATDAIHMVPLKVWSVEFNEGEKSIRIRFKPGGWIQLAEALIDKCHELGIEIEEISREGM